MVIYLAHLIIGITVKDSLLVKVILEGLHGLSSVVAEKLERTLLE
jgi:hypothetical protein